MLQKSTALTYYFYHKPHDSTLLRGTVVITRQRQASSKKTRVEFKWNEKHCVTRSHNNGILFISYYYSNSNREWVLLHLFRIFSQHCFLPFTSLPYWVLDKGKCTGVNKTQTISTNSLSYMGDNTNKHIIKDLKKGKTIDYIVAFLQGLNF